MHVINYHLIPCMSKKNIAKDMLDALVSLYQTENTNMNILQNKPNSVEITRLDLVTRYLVKVTWIHDQFTIVKENVVDENLVNVELSGFSISWEPFVKDICAHENLPNFERHCNDCI